VTPGWYRVQRHVHLGSVQEAFGVQADPFVLVQVHDPCQEHAEGVVIALLDGIVREVVEQVEGVGQRARRDTPGR